MGSSDGAMNIYFTSCHDACVRVGQFACVYHRWWCNMLSAVARLKMPTARSYYHSNKGLLTSTIRLLLFSKAFLSKAPWIIYIYLKLKFEVANWFKTRYCILQFEGHSILLHLPQPNSLAYSSTTIRGELPSLIQNRWQPKRMQFSLECQCSGLRISNKRSQFHHSTRRPL